jgi:hypothetical protein
MSVNGDFTQLARVLAVRRLPSLHSALMDGSEKQENFFHLYVR